ncbi:MAG: hypothetical protein DWQ53_07620 [Microcystis flos-aquae DF17]|nr:MAG: hypothetical protein DWQ53_07620 [Microcystis flos-aquae DF17]
MDSRNHSLGGRINPFEAVRSRSSGDRRQEIAFIYSPFSPLPSPHFPNPLIFGNYDRRIQLTTVKKSFIGTITQQLRGLF